MEDLTRHIAHDLNNQLAVILNYASFVLDDLDDPEQMHEDVSEIRNAAERARDLTQQLLEIGRAQAAQPVES
jgi:two-component system, cell cycle sensor histidine kinase and response regulator CckA